MPQRKPPPDARSGPQSPTGNRSSESTPTATATQQRITPTAIVGGSRGEREGHPIANASLYAPVARRIRWWLSVRCPFCDGVHLCRLKDESLAAGLRKLPCGRAWVTVRRVYRPAAPVDTESGVAA